MPNAHNIETISSPGWFDYTGLPHAYMTCIEAENCEAHNSLAASLMCVRGVGRGDLHGVVFNLASWSRVRPS
jgi:hypothetical protein